MAHAELADCIKNHIEDLTAAWLNLVRKDPRIQTDSELSENALRDHVPALIEEVSELLRHNECPSLTNTRDARVHTYLRLRQGYIARELVRELSLLRLTLIDHLSERLFERQDPVMLIAYSDAVRVINQYLDEEVTYAISVYTEETAGRRQAEMVDSPEG